ncbi:MAG: hydrolase, partial [bacterium]
DYFLATTKDVPDAINFEISGTFMTKVFDGPYQMVPKFMKEADQAVRATGKTPKKSYLFYTTCPKCAKIHGHNYIVVFTQIE